VRLDDARELLSAREAYEPEITQLAERRIAHERRICTPDLRSFETLTQGGSRNIAVLQSWCREQLIRLNLGLDSPDQQLVENKRISGAFFDKSVDLVAFHKTAGPTLAVSVKSLAKGVGKNLTNRVEEYVGEATNLHTRYPMLVFGFLILLEARSIPRNATDSDITFENTPTPSDLSATGLRVIERIRAFGNRRSPTDPVGAYEATSAMFVTNWTSENSGFGPGSPRIQEKEPAAWDRLAVQNFFLQLSELYQARNPMLVERTRLEGHYP
jgi:hypothetical protein